MFFEKFLKLLITSILLSYSVIVFGVQKIVVTDGEIIKIKLSEKELTRIAVDGGRIDKLWGATGILETQTDKKDGEIFLRPSSSAAKVFSFFIRDNFGSTYTMVADQVDIPSHTILLSPTNRLSNFDKEKFKNRGLVSQIKQLIKVMANPGDESKKIDSKEHNEEIRLWKESKITLIKSYELEKIKGEVFTIKNISKEEMQLRENEFLNFRPNVLAVAIDKSNLKQEEETKLYIVRRRE